MRCPICNGKTRVVNSRNASNRTKRRCECVECLTRFNTYERYDFNSLPDYLKDRVVNYDRVVESPEKSFF